MKKGTKRFLGFAIPTAAFALVARKKYVDIRYGAKNAKDTLKFSESVENESPEIHLTAHRGLSSVCPENTIEAFKEAAKYLVQEHWNETPIAEQAKSRIINRIKGNIQKQQNEIEQAAPLASSIIISNLSDFIKNKFLKTKLELISEIQNNNHHQLEYLVLHH